MGTDGRSSGFQFPRPWSLLFGSLRGSGPPYGPHLACPTRDYRLTLRQALPAFKTGRKKAGISEVWRRPTWWYYRYLRANTLYFDHIHTHTCGRIPQLTSTMAKSSKKRERSDEDVVDNHDAKPIVKKSKLDSTGKAEVTKKSSKTKEAKTEAAAVDEAPKAKKEKKEKKEKKDKKEKKEKKDKKEKKEKSKDVDAAAESAEPAPEPATEEAVNGDASTDKKSKKAKDDKKKDKKDKKSKKSKAAPAADEPEEQAKPDADDDDTAAANGNGSNGKQNRFICFVGNLPFTATADAVRAHFASLQPTSVRLLTQRDDPSKSRGIAFVEFGGYDHMKTCLKKFHHTDFDDGKSAPRKINVELTYVFFFLFFLSLSSTCG